MDDVPTPVLATITLTRAATVPDATTIPKLGARELPRSNRIVLGATRAIFRMWTQLLTVPVASIVASSVLTLGYPGALDSEGRQAGEPPSSRGSMQRVRYIGTL